MTSHSELAAAAARARVRDLVMMPLGNAGMVLATGQGEKEAVDAEAATGADVGPPSRRNKFTSTALRLGKQCQTWSNGGRAAGMASGV